MNMNSEPIRLPALLTGLILVLGPVVIAYLLGADVRSAAATAIAGLIAGGGVIARAESVRARTDSPATVEARFAEAQARVDLSSQPAEVFPDLSGAPVDSDAVIIEDLRERLATLEGVLTRRSDPTGF